MRVSQFVVLSDQVCADPAGTEVRVILQSLSGEVYVLPEEVIQKAKNDPASLPDAAVAELTEAGVLVEDDLDEFSPVVAENIAATRDTTARRFVLMPTSYCNMGCGYCGQRHTKAPRNASHRRAVIDRITQAARAAPTKSVHISWFGAEPMMGYAQIVDISTAVIPVCADNGVQFSAKMVTNGSLLTHRKIRSLYHACQLTQFVITLDGPAALHDSQRPLKSGRASFDRIVATIAEACQDNELPNLAFTIRTNVSRTNQDAHVEFATAMRAAGLANPKVYFYTALVRPWGNDVSDFAIRPQDVVAVERQWLQAYQDFGLTTAIVPIGRTKEVCVTVSRAAEVIDPNGSVHSCTEQPLVPGREHTAVGHVVDLPAPELRPPGAYDSWNHDLLGPTDAHCPSCSIFPMCGGACPLVWHEGRPACPPLKQTLPMRLTLYGESLGLRGLVPTESGTGTPPS